MSNRLVVKAELQPVAGSVFQPTGFPDLGPARFERPLKDGTLQSCLLVESAQSMTNHLEALGWDSVTDAPSEFLSKLPYVRVADTDGSVLTSSRLEPHRIASPYVGAAEVEGQKGVDWLIAKLMLQKGKPTDWRQLYERVFEIDPLCLIHGIFLSSKQLADYGNPKIRRVTTVTVEAHGVQEVVSGGVKRDDVNPTSAEGRGSADLYGFIPFGRVEFTAAEIQLAATVDLQQIRGYGLSAEKTELLESVAQWQLAKLLSEPLRLRTACDLELVGEIQISGVGTLPAVTELEERIANSPVVFEAPGATDAVWTDTAKKTK